MKLFNPHRLSKLIIMTIIAIIVTSFGAVVFGDDVNYFIQFEQTDHEWNNPYDEYGLVKFNQMSGGVPSSISAKNMFDAMYNRTSQDPLYYTIRLSYGGEDVVYLRSDSDITLRNVTEAYTTFNSADNQYLYSQPGFKKWLEACSNGNLDIPLKVEVGCYDQNGNFIEWKELPIITSPGSGNGVYLNGMTWLEAVTGMKTSNDVNRALTRIGIEDGSISGDALDEAWETVWGYSDEEVGGFFKSLSDAIGDAIYGLANLLYNLVQDGLKTIGNVNNGGKLVTIDDVVFDRYSETSLDFWDTSNSHVMLGKFKDNILKWYNRFRGLAIAGYLILLLYIGIRVLLAVGGRQQERYKEMLLSWVQGVVILFLFPLVIRYAVKINHAFVTEISRGEKERKVSSGVSFTYPTSDLDDEDAQIAALAVTSNPFTAASSQTDYMASMAYSYKNEKSIPKAIVYLIMVIQFIMILITYYKRLFMFSFLLTIFPIVAFTYALDKVGDGSAQAFNTYTKEIFLNVFMQCIHSVIYVFVMSVVFNNVSGGNYDFILTIVGITFLFKGEEILRSILGQSGGDTVKSMKDTAAKAAASIAVTQAVANKITGGAGKLTGAVRAERQARADTRIARSMRGEETTFRGRTRNMIDAFKGGRDKNNWETRREFAKRVVNARKAPTAVGWARDYMSGGNGARISVPPPQTTDGRDYLEAARILSDPISENATPEQMAQALDTVRKLDGSTNAEVVNIKAQMGISDEQLRMISGIQASAAKQMLAIDTTNDEGYQEKILKINKFLTVNLSQVLTGSKKNGDNQEVVMWTRAILGDLRNVSSAQIRAGIGDDEYIPGARKALNNAMSSSEQRKVFESKVEKLQALVDVNDREKIASGALFAADTSRRKGLTSTAMQERDRFIRMFESDPEKRRTMRAPRQAPTGFLDNDRDERAYQYALKGMSDKDKAKLATHLAVIKDFGARSHMTAEQLAVDDDIKGYTVKDLSDSLEALKKLSEEHSQVESIISNELGFNSQELSEIGDNIIALSFPDLPGSSSVIAENLDSKVARQNVSQAYMENINQEDLGTIRKQRAVLSTRKVINQKRKNLKERKERDIVHTVRNVNVTIRDVGGGSIPSSNAPEGVEFASGERNTSNLAQSRVHAQATAGTSSRGEVSPAPGVSTTTSATRPTTSGSTATGEARPSAGGGTATSATGPTTSGSTPATEARPASGTSASSESVRPASSADRVTGRAEAQTMESAGEDSRTRMITPEEIVDRASRDAGVSSSNATKRMTHRYRRTSTNGDVAIDDLFDFTQEHKDFDLTAIGEQVTSRDALDTMTADQRRVAEARNASINRTNDYLDAVGQLMAGDNREKIAGITDDLLQGMQEVHENLMAPRLEGMTADEYEARAKAARKQAIQDALVFSGGTIGGIALGTAGGFLNIGMSDKDSMIEEFGTGFVAGAATGAGSAKMAFEGVGEKTIKVYNHYDGSYTDVKIKKYGGLFDGQTMPMSLQDGEVVDINDPRLAKVRTKVEGVLASAAHDNRIKRQNDAAQKRASKFEEALNSRSTGNNNKK